MKLDRFLQRLSEAPPEGTHIGRYEVVRVVAEGGFAVVYQARDPDLDRDVAIKVLHRADPERLRIEATAAAQLHHPNIVTVFEVGPNYIVMEFVAGKTLAEAMPELSLDDRLRTLVQVARAVAYAHGHGVIHRDLKPGNVIVNAARGAVLSDFGLAKIATGEGVTIGGSLLGTPAYMSPEQVTGRPTDGMTDIWSLGVMLYEMAAGRRPFEGENPFATYELVKHQGPAPLAGPLWAITRKALDKNSRRRYPSAAEFADDVERFLRHEKIMARGSRARAWWLVAAAPVAIAAGFLLWSGDPSPRAPPGAAAQGTAPPGGAGASAKAAVEDLVQKLTFLERTESEALRANPDNVTRLLSRANLRVMRGLTGADFARDPLPDWLAAESDLTAALAIQPNSEDIIFRRGELRARIASRKFDIGVDPGTHCEAPADLDRVEHMAGARLWRSTAAFFCGLWLHQHGRDARENFLRAEADLTPADAGDKLWRRGRARAFLGKFAEAERDFAEAVRLLPGEDLASVWWAIARRQAGDLPGSEQHATRALTVAPTHYRGWEVRGDARLALGNFTGALADYRKVIELDPAREPLLKIRITAASRAR